MKTPFMAGLNLYNLNLNGFMNLVPTSHVVQCYPYRFRSQNPWLSARVMIRRSNYPLEYFEYA